MRLNSPLLISFAGRLSAMVLRLLFRSLRLELHTSKGVQPYRAVGERRYFYSVWHDSAIFAAFGGRHSRTVALTSRHRDGSFVESALAGAGVSAVRGSSGRNGPRAIRALIELAKTKDIVMTPDGPRGPNRIMSRGIIYLASRTGNAIVPTAFVCDRVWEIRGSWTTVRIPKLFSRVILLAGDPIHVPANLDEQQIESYRCRVQRAMDELDQIACAQQAVKNPPSCLGQGTATRGRANPASAPVDRTPIWIDVPASVSSTGS